MARATRSSFIGLTLAAFVTLGASSTALADQSCSVSVDIVNAVSLGSAEVDISFDAGNVLLTNCFRTGILAINNHQITSGSFSGDVLCSFVTDPPCTEAINGDAPLMTCCLVVGEAPLTSDFTPTLSNTRTLTGTPTSAGVAVSDVSCGLGNACCCLSTTTTLTSATTTTMPAAMPGCGDPDGDQAVTALDALIALLAAVGLGPCPVAFCDVDGSSLVDAGDALILLYVAVGLSFPFVCPAA